MTELPSGRSARPDAQPRDPLAALFDSARETARPEFREALRGRLVTTPAGPAPFLLRGPMAARIRLLALGTVALAVGVALVAGLALELRGRPAGLPEQPLPEAPAPMPFQPAESMSPTQDVAPPTLPRPEEPAPVAPWQPPAPLRMAASPTVSATPFEATDLPPDPTDEDDPTGQPTSPSEPSSTPTSDRTSQPPTPPPTPSPEQSPPARITATPATPTPGTTPDPGG